MANACGELQGLEVAIVGASIGGLGCANVLLQLGASVSVVERYSRGFNSRGGGINADAKLLMEITQQEEPPKRLPGGGGFYYGDVWSYLNQALPVNTVRYGIEISEIEDATSNRPALVVDGAREEYDLIICADGGWSTLRRYVTDVTPTYAGYVLWRGLVDLSVVHGFKSWGTFRKGNITTSSYPVRGPGRSGVYLQCGVYIAQPEAEIYRPSRGANRMVTVKRQAPPSWFLPLVESLFRHEAGGDVVRKWRKIVEAKACEAHPVYEVAATQVVAGRVVLVGDAAHMGSPNTGAGGHTSLLDALFLREILRQTPLLRGGLPEALAQYNGNGVARAQELLAVSRRVGQRYAPDPAAVEPPALLLSRLLRGGGRGEQGMLC